MLAFSDEGSGSPLVFLPGITCSREHWRPVADLLSGDFRCVLIDPPGHGESSLGSMDVIDLAGAIREVLDHLAVEAPILVGHSAGGIAATIYGVVHPCRGVFSIEGTLDLTGPFARDVYAARDDLRDAARFEEAFWGVVAPMRADLIPEERREWAVSLIGARPEVVLEAWSGLIDGQGEELTRQIEAVLPDLAVPLLSLWGDEVLEGERRMAALAPEGVVESWPGLGHFVHLVDPERTALRIREFADRVAG